MHDLHPLCVTTLFFIPLLDTFLPSLIRQSLTVVYVIATLSILAGTRHGTSIYLSFVLHSKNG